MSEPRWEDLPPTARPVVAKLVKLLAGGFTGQLLLECNQGGVKFLQESSRHTPTDIENSETDP